MGTPVQSYWWGKKLRSTLPLAPEKLTLNGQKQSSWEKLSWSTSTSKQKNYNWRLRASVLPVLKPGEKVWVTDRSAPAVIVQKSPEPGSYVVKTDQSLLRRNRRQLVETPTPAPKLEKQKRDDLPKCESSNNFTVTRSGRTVIPPKRLELQK